eukprot:52118-Pleurochrysis_carterae.AAC.1
MAVRGGQRLAGADRGRRGAVKVEKETDRAVVLWRDAGVGGGAEKMAGSEGHWARHSGEAKKENIYQQRV